MFYFNLWWNYIFVFKPQCNKNNVTILVLWIKNNFIQKCDFHLTKSVWVESNETLRSRSTKTEQTLPTQMIIIIIRRTARTIRFCKTNQHYTVIGFTLWSSTSSTTYTPLVTFLFRDWADPAAIVFKLQLTLLVMTKLLSLEIIRPTCLLIMLCQMNVSFLSIPFITLNNIFIKYF